MINALTIAEIFSVGSLTAVIGMGITFLMLVLLVFVLTAMHRTKKKETSTEAIAVLHEFVLQKNDDAIIAAISAAIAAVMSCEAPTNKAKASFVVKSIRRI
ncbi:MAG: OadG family transporter subunit [Clostridia bacterium]|nr:OadG family transporter subunit [Clostridia bacterium]